MSTVEIDFLHRQLEERRRRLEAAIALAPQNGGLAGLLKEVDSALERMSNGKFGICEECHDTVERDRLMADPLVRFCLDHLTNSQRDALQRDLDLASAVQRNLLPQPGLCEGTWETSYSYAPVGAVSGDYLDLIPSDGNLFFALGDVSGKGVAASMLMTQLHALFRSLTGVGLPLGQIVTKANRVFCEGALTGQYATLVCGLAMANGDVEIHNAGHWPVVIAGHGGVMRLESTGLPLGMFCEAQFSATRVHLEPGDSLFLYTDGLLEARKGEDEYGVDRVTTLVRQKGAGTAPELVAAFLEDLRDFSDEAPMDDMSLMAIKRRK